MSTEPLVKTKPVEQPDEPLPGDGLFSERNLRRASPYIFTIGLFVIWEIGCVAFDIKEYVMPRPSQFFFILVTRAPYPATSMPPSRRTTRSMASSSSTA